MVKWEGYSRNMQCHLAALDKAPDGSDLGLKLLPYANGDPAPVFFTNDEFDVEHDPLDEANEAEEDEEEAEPDAPNVFSQSFRFHAHAFPFRLCVLTTIVDTRNTIADRRERE